MATTYANAIRAGLLSALKADLPPKLTALNLPPIETWFSKRDEPRSTHECPAVVVRFMGWSQGEGGAGPSIGGADTYIERLYDFRVLVVIHDDDPEEADEALAAYADAIAAVLDDYDNMTLGGAAEDILLAMRCSTTPGLNIEGFSRRVRAAGIDVRVKIGREAGEYT